MNIIKKNNREFVKERGFILLSTLVLLLIISIVVLSTYFNAVSGVKSSVSVKDTSEADIRSMKAIGTIEDEIMKTDAGLNPSMVDNGGEVCTLHNSCKPVTTESIHKIVKMLDKGGADDPSEGMKKLTEVSDDKVVVYYKVQNLGLHDEAKFPTAYIYRITVLSYHKTSGSYSVYESGYLYDLEWDKVWAADIP